MIYFAQDMQTKAIKIGYSKNPKKRRSGLQTASPNPLVLLGQIHGGLEDERWLHDKFAKHRIQGEWFQSVILAEVQLIITNNPIDRPPPSNVVVIGDSHFRDKAVVIQSLDELKAKNPIAWVITGGERSLERWAWEWAKEHDVRICPYFPKWSTQGKFAGFKIGTQLIRSMFDPKTFLVFLVDGGTPSTNKLIGQVQRKGFELVLKRIPSDVRFHGNQGNQTSG